MLNDLILALIAIAVAGALIGRKSGAAFSVALSIGGLFSFCATYLIAYGIACLL